MSSTECSVLFCPESPELRFLPEGPYSLADGRLSWVGIQHGSESTIGSVNILDLDSRTNQSWNLPGRPGFAFPTSKAGTFICGVERALGLFDTSTSQWTSLVENIDSAVDNTIINDGVVYGSHLIFGCKELEFKTKKAGLYLWKDGRELIQLRDDQICSNGKAVIQREDGQLWLIDIDSPSKTITRSALDLQTGSIGDPETVVDLTDQDVFPDGMLVTPDGNSLIVALYDPGDPAAGAARQYDLQSGQLQAVWTCPGSPRVTCPQLVQHAGSIKLVLTTAVEHMEEEQQQRHSNAGCLFIGDTAFDSVGDQPVFPLPPQ